MKNNTPKGTRRQGIAVLFTLAALFAAVPAEGAQQRVAPTQAASTVSGSTANATIQYSTDDGDQTLAGLGIRIHYNSSKVSSIQLSSVLATNLFVQPATPQDDSVSNFDGDATTDKFLRIVWADFSNSAWPNTALPVNLFQIQANLSAGLGAGESTSIRFSADPDQLASGYTFAGTAWTITKQGGTPTAPVIDSAGTKSGVVGTELQYQITASNGPTSFGATGLPSWLTVDSNGLVKGTPTSAGTFNIVVTATNAGGTGQKTVTITVTTAVVAPVIDSAGTKSGVVGTEHQYQITASNGPTSFGATGLPSWLTVDSNGLVKGTPTSAGTFNIVVTATNAGGTGQKTVTITVTAAVVAPVISSAGTKSGSVGTELQYQITASNGPTSFGATGLPNWLTVDSNGLVKGTPPATGTFDIVVTATNSAGTGQKTVTISVVAAPVITSSASVTGQVGVPFTHQIVATNSPTFFYGFGFPPGLDLNGDTGLLSGTPTAPGGYDGYVSVSNTTGSSTQDLYIEILDASGNSTLSGGDSFAAPTQLLGSTIRVQVNASAATVEQGEPYTQEGDKSLWWKWTAPENGLVELALDGSYSASYYSFGMGPKVGTVSSFDWMSPEKWLWRKTGSSRVLRVEAGKDYLITAQASVNTPTAQLTIRYPRTTYYQGYIRSLPTPGLGPGFVRVTLSKDWKHTTMVSFGSGNLLSGIRTSGIVGPQGQLLGPKGQALPYGMKLDLDVTGGTDTLSLSNSLTPDVAPKVVAHRSGYDKKLKPFAKPGYFTLLIEPDSGDHLNPQGVGFGSLKIDAAGTAKFAGVLGDGTKFLHTTKLADNGTIPFAVEAYKKLAGGGISGSVAIADADSNTLNGTLNWSKPAAGLEPVYPAGFTTTATLTVGRYDPNQLPVLTAPNTSPNAVISVWSIPVAGSKTDFAGTYSGLFEKFLPLDPNLKFTLNAKTGFFKGTLALPNMSGAGRVFNGAILRTENRGAGLYLETGSNAWKESGPVDFLPNP